MPQSHSSAAIAVETNFDNHLGHSSLNVLLTIHSSSTLHAGTWNHMLPSRSCGLKLGGARRVVLSCRTCEGTWPGAVLKKTSNEEHIGSDCDRDSLLLS